MRYRDDMMNKMPTTQQMPSVAGTQQIPSTCGACSGGMPTAMNQGAMPATMNHNGMPSLSNMGGFPMQPYMNNESMMVPKLLNGSFMGGINGSSMGVPQPSQMLPATLPAAASTAPMVPSAPGLNGTAAVPVTPGWTQLPTTVESVLFTPGFLRTQIGRRVRVEFLIGTNNLTDRTGTLVAVGASYILIRPIDSDDLMMCDMYSIKFVTIIL